MQEEYIVFFIKTIQIQPNLQKFIKKPIDRFSVDLSAQIWIFNTGGKRQETIRNQWVRLQKNDAEQGSCNHNKNRVHFFYKEEQDKRNYIENYLLPLEKGQKISRCLVGGSVQKRNHKHIYSGHKNHTRRGRSEPIERSLDEGLFLEI